MTTKHNLFAGGIIAVLATGALFTVGQKTLIKLQGNSTPKQRPGLWRGSNELDHTQSNETHSIQHSQASRPGTPAEIIGRTGYPLYT